MNNPSLPLFSDIDCPHFEKCSGCEISKNVNNPPLLEEAKVYFKEKGILEFNNFFGPSKAWRFRAKLVVRGTSENPEIGLYQKNTHNVLDIPFCQVHHLKLNQAVLFIKKFIQDKKIIPYNEKTGQGLLRYIQLTVEKRTGKVQLVFVLNSLVENDLKKWDLKNEEFWHSIWLNLNPSRTNNIFSSSWTHVCGPPLIYEQLAGIDVCFHPSSFMQANLELFEKLLTSIYENVPQNSHVVEYYAGVGVIGLKIADKCASVVCSEITPSAEECFNFAKEKLSPEIQKRISFQTGLSEKHSHLLKNKTVAIVDPPRKGLDLGLLKNLTEEKSLEKIFYISCGFKAFKRDCDLILASGEWILEKIETYIFFPGTNHIEIFAIFKRN